MTWELVLFTDGDLNIEVQVSPEQQTVWLTQKQIETLFGVSHATISEHINNILSSGELDETSVGFSDKSSGGRKPKVYNLDMILSVGYREWRQKKTLPRILMFRRKCLIFSILLYGRMHNHVISCIQLGKSGYISGTNSFLILKTPAITAFLSSNSSKSGKAKRHGC